MIAPLIYHIAPYQTMVNRAMDISAMMRSDPQ
jgi:hypothetical protein